MHLWKYNRITGYWEHVRAVTPETASRWLEIFSADEPNEYFKLGKVKPRDKPTIRRKNPGPRHVHTKAWDRCVRDVKRKGTAVDPYAVCTAALGEMGILKAHRNRGPIHNPVRDPEHRKLLARLSKHFQSDERAAKVVRPVSYLVTATKGPRRLFLTRENKFSSGYDKARRFKTVREATARARTMLGAHPHLRAYRLDVRLGY